MADIQISRILSLCIISALRVKTKLELSHHIWYSYGPHCVDWSLSQNVKGHIHGVMKCAACR